MGGEEKEPAKETEGAIMVGAGGEPGRCGLW